MRQFGKVDIPQNTLFFSHTVLYKNNFHKIFKLLILKL